MPAMPGVAVVKGPISCGEKDVCRRLRVKTRGKRGSEDWKPNISDSRRKQHAPCTLTRATGCSNTSFTPYPSSVNIHFHMSRVYSHELKCAMPILIQPRDLSKAIHECDGKKSNAVVQSNYALER